MGALVLDPGLETGENWTFVSDGAASGARSTSNPYLGTWHGRLNRVADGAVFGGFRNASAIVTLLTPPLGVRITVSLYAMHTSTTEYAVDIDVGDGGLVFLDGVAPTDTYSQATFLPFIYAGPAAPRVRIRTVSGAAGRIDFDQVRATYPVTLYPKGPVRFQEAYTDDILGIPVIRSEAIRDVNTLIRHVDDEGALDADFERRMWPGIKELRDDEP
jgi:hypothetical protein